MCQKKIPTRSLQLDVGHICRGVSVVIFSDLKYDSGPRRGRDMMHLEVEMPPECFVTEIARGLRSAMGVPLFNFDVIKDGRVGNHYLVIDINYFPWYEKLPGYEMILTDFLCSMVQKEEENHAG